MTLMTRGQNILSFLLVSLGTLGCHQGRSDELNPVILGTIESDDESFWGVPIEDCPEELLDLANEYEDLLGPSAEEHDDCYLKFRTDRTLRIIKPLRYGALSLKLRWAKPDTGWSPTYEKYEFLRPRNAFAESYSIGSHLNGDSYQAAFDVQVRETLAKYIRRSFDFDLQRSFDYVPNPINADDFRVFVGAQNQIFYFSHGAYFFTRGICDIVNNNLEDCIDNKPLIRMPVDMLPMHPMQPHPEVLDFLDKSKTAISPFRHPASFLGKADIDFTQKDWFFSKESLSELVNKLLQNGFSEDNVRKQYLRTGMKQVTHIEILDAPDLVVRCPIIGNEYLSENELAVYEFEQSVTQTRTVIPSVERTTTLFGLPAKPCLYSFFLRGMEPSWRDYDIGTGRNLKEYVDFNTIDQQMSSNEYAYPVAILQLLTGQSDHAESANEPKNVFWLMDGRTVLFDSDFLDMAYQKVSEPYLRSFYKEDPILSEEDQGYVARLREIDFLSESFERNETTLKALRGIKKFATRVVDIIGEDAPVHTRVCNIVNRIHYIAGHNGALPDQAERERIRLGCQPSWSRWAEFSSL